MCQYRDEPVYIYRYIYTDFFCPFGAILYIYRIIDIPNILQNFAPAGQFHKGFLNNSSKYTENFAPSGRFYIYTELYIYRVFYKISPLRGETIHIPNYIYTESSLYRNPRFRTHRPIPLLRDTISLHL